MSFYVGYTSTIFLATFSEQCVTPSNPVVFDVVRLDSGENYNPATGIYTVPISGIYEFHAQIYVDNDEDLTWAFYINVDGTRIRDSAHAASTATYDYTSSTATVILNLTQGQQVSVTLYELIPLYGAHTDKDNRMNSWFSGRLIIATYDSCTNRCCANNKLVTSGKQ